MLETKLPDWVSTAEKILREASTRVRMIAATTPIELSRELDRLREKWQSGDVCPPRFVYATPPDHRDLIAALEKLAENLIHEGPLAVIHAERAREIVFEAEIASSAGTSRLRSWARQRFSRRDHFDDAADALARGWLDEPFSDSPIAKSDLVLSDDPRDPHSLLNRLRSEMGQRKIPFRVVIARDSSALAATGESFVQIASGRWMTATDVERTVLHEIEGHVLPRCRANTQRLGIFALGTRFGVDDQEGRALCIERRAGFLQGSRRRELALRHKAARMLEDNADFVEIARVLLRCGSPLSDALRITARVCRGGGLGREIVYLPAFLRVDAALTQSPGIDHVLGAGRVSVAAAELLQPWVEKMH